MTGKPPVKKANLAEAEVQEQPEEDYPDADGDGVDDPGGEDPEEEEKLYPDVPGPGASQQEIGSWMQTAISAHLAYATENEETEVQRGGWIAVKTRIPVGLNAALPAGDVPVPKAEALRKLAQKFGVGPKAKPVTSLQAQGSVKYDADYAADTACTDVFAHERHDDEATQAVTVSGVGGLSLQLMENTHGEVMTTGTQLLPIGKLASKGCLSFVWLQGDEQPTAVELPTETVAKIHDAIGNRERLKVRNYIPYFTPQEGDQHRQKLKSVTTKND